jgi:predicted nucleic acid-binding protein
MTAKVFLDTNIVVYLLSADNDKVTVVENLMQQNPLISTQVVHEFINCCLKKIRLSRDDTFALANQLMEASQVVAMDKTISQKAMQICSRYQFSFWDSLIVAAALQANCKVLYSEDMQHLQWIDDALQIINPFIKP